MQRILGYNRAVALPTARPPRGAIVVAIAAMLSSAAGVEAFNSCRTAMASSSRILGHAASRGRGRSSSAPSSCGAIAEPAVHPQEGAYVVRQSKDGCSPLTFFERLGSPRYIAAPMVEHSEAAFRYLVRRHGTHLAYTQMIHSAKFAEAKAEKFRQTRFDGTNEEEDRPLVVQFCGNDPDTVVRAARHIEDRVDAVDLNLGCPQKIARRGNYGAYLLQKPDLCEKIIATMSRYNSRYRQVLAEKQLPHFFKSRDDQYICCLFDQERELLVPVTVKIRALENDADTLDLARRLEGAGAQLLTVHGRTVRQSKTTQGVANWDIIRQVKEAVSIPVVGNGGVETRADAERLLKATGADAVMSSEGLLENPSLFDPNMVPLDELRGIEVAHRLLSLAAEYMELANRFSTPMISVKGHLFKMMYRLLTCHTDLRDRLAHWAADIEVADAVVNEMSQRYFFDPLTRTPREGLAGASDLPISSKSWYHRHWQE